MSFEAFNNLPSRVEIVEVGLRDGLQREATIIPAEKKVALINALVGAGLKRIQITAFVHPRIVPQMADAEKVCHMLTSYPDVVYSGLALNLKGVKRANQAGISHIDMSVSASHEHSLRNANRTIEEALTEYSKMYDCARSFGMTVRGGIQCAFGYQNPTDVDPQTVFDIADFFLSDLGVDELALADSSGLADPAQLLNLIKTIVPLAGEKPIILHLHDTRGMGLANVLAALQCGVFTFDTAVGGLGGCPFIDGATGNIATEDTVYMLHQMGIQTGIDIEKLAVIAEDLKGILGKSSLPGKISNLLFPN